jgi:type IV fimbrial biogenesis protein FimT
MPAAHFATHSATHATEHSATRNFSAVPSNPRKRGFTLVELMVVIVIAAILLAITIPAMSGFVHDSRVSANVNEFISAITLARTEAVKRGRLVTMCRSRNADSDPPSCDGSSNDWAAGWLLYEEGSSATNVGTYEAGETVILRRGVLPDGTMAPASSADMTTITFNALGEPIGVGAVAFNFSVNQKRPREVCVSRNGRVKVLPGATNDSGC